MDRPILAPIYMGENEENGEGLILTEGLLIRYLLGELEESARARIQEQCFGDDLLFDRILEAENDLIDRYARRELGVRERELFEKTVLQRESMGQRVTFATALSSATAKGKRAGTASKGESTAAAGSTVTLQAQVRSRPKLLWYGLAAAAALLVVLGVVWVIRNQERAGQRAGGQSIEQQASNRTPANPSPSADSNTEASSTKGAASGQEGHRTGPRVESKYPLAVGTFVLLPGSTRSSVESQALTIGPSVREIRLQLQLSEGDDYKSYGVILRTVQGTEILRKSGLSPSGKAVKIGLAASRLAPGQYELELTSHPDQGPDAVVNYYYFTVAR